MFFHLFFERSNEVGVTDGNILLYILMFDTR